MSIINAVEDLFKSFYELIASIVSTIYNLILTFVNAIVSFFSGIVNVIVDIFSGAVEIVGGTAKFLLGNFVIVGLVAAGGYAYFRYTEQGRRVAANAQKKTA
ncbi:hypothetical protein B0T11DRAFT_275234 [Plectosphaerella cucumerina]|uniref:Uncharacterized protein n=1 Tax=Plectosphaerella cucumerina TaxID=40658 RepID=A0A8K0TLK0_9PEZI|nr:hypothetical protein B0T11DRAFT_275234 [Plectosphaerella cucumerina]